MTSTYPTSNTSYTNPGPTDGTAVDVGARTHDEFHTDNNDDLEQLMAKVGTGASTPTNKTVFVGNGTGSSAYSANPTISGTIIAETDLRANVKVQAGTKVYPGTLNGPATGLQSSVSAQVPYLNHTSGGLAANTSATISSFPMGIFICMNANTGDVAVFLSNSVATLTPISAPASIQIAGADPGASSSKIWISLSGGTLQVYNRYATAQALSVLGLGSG